MITRRTFIGAGLAFTSVACATAFGADGATERRRPDERAVDALLIDETIEMPGQLSMLIEGGRQTLPVVGIQLDAASHAGLISVLNKSQTIVGLSSGATLFCLERMAWDHGLRLTERSQRCASDSGGDACWRDVNALLSAAHPLSASPLSDVRAYTPSRDDGTLHIWTMRRYAAPQLNNGRQEI